MSQTASHVAADEAAAATLTPARCHAKGRAGFTVPELKAMSLRMRRDIITLLIDASRATRAGRCRAPTSAPRCSSTS